MQMSKKVTKGGGITIPRILRQETGILPGVPVDVTADAAGIHIVKHVPACRFCGTEEVVAGYCGHVSLRSCAGMIVEVFQ